MDTIALHGVDDATTAALLESASAVVVERGQRVFTEGEPAGGIYLVMSGKIKISRRTPTGAETLLAVLGPGQLFGELSVLDGAPRSASAQAVTAAELRELTQERIRDLVAVRPEIAQWLLLQLARRLRVINDVAADLVFSDVPTRVARVLLNLARDFGVDAATGVRVDHGLTQLELAQLAGAARETVNKALATFAFQGWLTLRSRSVLIHDLPALQRRAG